MAHIPQPAAGGNVPTTEISSTDEPPAPPTLSAIDTPGPNPREVVDHTGASNALDPYLYMQWISILTLPWTTSDQPGKLIKAIRVSPEIHPILRILKLIYNAWGGGIMLMVKVCGTGFHAGLLGIARIPPNFVPEDWAGGKDWTCFPYTCIDPKMLEPAVVHIRDQRPIAYHYSTPPSGQPESWDIGGHVGFFVMDSLATSSTGINQIQIEVFCKAAPDFNFSQMIIPPPEHGDNIKEFPLTLARTFQFSNFANKVLATNALESDYLTAQPSSLKELIQYRYNCFDFNGSPSSKTFYGTYQSTGTSITVYFNKEEMTLTFKNGFWDQNSSICSIYDDKESVAVLEIDVPTDFTPPITIKVASIKAQSGAVDTGEYTYDVIQQTKYSNVITEPDALAAYTANESFLLFEEVYSSGQKSLQLSSTASELSSGRYSKVIPRNSCALFKIVKDDDQLPLGYAKLYSQGFLTTSATQNAIRYKLKDISLIFDSFMPRTDGFPANPMFAQNRMLYALSVLHKRRALN